MGRESKRKGDWRVWEKQCQLCVGDKIIIEWLRMICTGWRRQEETTTMVQKQTVVPPDPFLLIPCGYNSVWHERGKELSCLRNSTHTSTADISPAFHNCSPYLNGPHIVRAFSTVY